MKKEVVFRELRELCITNLVLKIFNTKKLIRIKTIILNLVIKVYFS